MAIKYAIASGNWSNSAIWNGGTIPAVGDDVWANTFTVNVDQNITVSSLNNSAIQVPTDLVPVMTSNTAPYGICSASANASTAVNAFDNNGSTTWTGVGTTGWISYQAIAANTAQSYNIYVGNTTTATARNWTFEGSNDGSNWTVLDTRTGITPSLNAWGIYSVATPGSYIYYRLNVTATNGGTNLIVTEFRPSTLQPVLAGGTFNFNTAGVTATCTSTSASLSQSATNLITVSATSGTVSLSLASFSSPPSIAGMTVILHSGNCNLNLTCPIISNGGANNNIFLNKTGNGNLTMTGNVTSQTSTTSSFAITTATIGTITVNGNVIGNTSTGNLSHAISQTSGNLVINGNVIGANNNSTTFGINFTGSSLTVNGNVVGGNAGAAITTTASTINVTGNVYGTSANAISMSSTGTINVTGNVYGGTTASAINSSSSAGISIIGNVYSWAVNSASGIVTLTGDMYNSLGKNAIISQLLYISDSTTTKWVMDLGGGATKTLYSADTFPNVPAITNVRSGITYGPALSLTGTMVVPAASDVRIDVPVDATVGTGELTSADIISGINASADPLAVRMKTSLSDKTAGNLISQYNNS